MNIVKEIQAGSVSELRQAIERAVPGDVITLANGTWTDVRVEFTGKGTEEQPITLKAETAGEVIFTGASSLLISGEHLVVDGLFFKDGIQPGIGGESIVIAFAVNSRHCTLINTAIIDYRTSDREKKGFWLTLEGSHHRVVHCLFKGKDYAGQLLRNVKYSPYNRIEYNHFVDIPAFGFNGLEIIQVMGIGSDGELGSAGGDYVFIENNLFERADGECAEVISLKSNHDVIRNNTFKESMGGLVIRSGHNTVVEGNVFIGSHIGGTEGIRITGEDNVVTGNYLTGLQGFGISVMAGEYIDHPLTDEFEPALRPGTPLGRVPFYNWSRNNVISGNILIGNEQRDLDMGIGYTAGWPKRQRVLLPENNRLADNVIVKERGVSYTEAKQDPSVIDMVFVPNRFENNIVSYPQEEGVLLPEGIAYGEVALVQDETGLARPAADGTTRLPGLMQEDQVGPGWASRKKKAGDPLFQPRDQFATVEPVPWRVSAEILVLCAGSSDVFVGNWRMKLDASLRALCPIQRNGRLLVPIWAAAQRLGCQTTAGVDGQTVSIYLENETAEISKEGCVIRGRDGQHDVGAGNPQIIDGVLYLDAEDLAELLGKRLHRDASGLAVLAQSAEDLSAFQQPSTLEQAIRLFRVTASRFEKRMTLPPQGHTHGNTPAHTVDAQDSTCWCSFGDGEWIRYDGGQTQEMGHVEIAFVPGDRMRYSFDMEVSADGYDWVEVYRGESKGEAVETIRFTPVVSARYLRIVGHGNERNNANRYSRVQIFTPEGTPIL